MEQPRGAFLVGVPGHGRNPAGGARFRRSVHLMNKVTRFDAVAWFCLGWTAALFFAWSVQGFR
jgi:hypothetical protein